MFVVKTVTRLVVFGPHSLRDCKLYIRQALLKGSEPGFLRVEHVS